MKNQLTLLFFVILITNALANDDIDLQVRLQNQNQLTKDSIIDIFIERGNLKELFKVWHSIYKLDYDYNSEEGINRYRVFKANLKKIQEHNRVNQDYKLGINEYSDKTDKELENYFKIRAITPEEFRQSTKRFLVNLDDYDDSQENEPDPPQTNKNEPDPPQKSALDYTLDFTPIRNQGSCGSCYAFSTVGSVEGNYVVGNRIRKTPVSKVVLAPQQLVDCDYNSSSGNWGCSGGWMKHASDSFKTKPPMLESNYPYKATLGTCAFNSGKLSPVRVTGYESPKSGDTGVFTLLQKGPIAQYVNVQSSFYSYKSGLYNPVCNTTCHHAIVLMGWGTDKTLGNYWLARNSWGTSWGLSGYFKVKDVGTANGYSCMLGHPSFSMRPITN